VPLAGYTPPMPEVRVNGANIHYESHGSGPETIVFVHGLLMSSRMFDDQVRAFSPRYRCITYDLRGQGKSEVTASGYDMDTLTEDAAALIAALGCAPCHFAGVSMGGFIGLRLALRRPALLRSLILIETSADPEPQRVRYRMLNVIARLLGFRFVIRPVRKILFGRKFLGDSSRAEQRREWESRILANDRIGITRAVVGVIERSGIYDEIDRITIPTLVIVGEDDVATLPEKSERIHARIRGSKFVTVPFAGHSSTLEEPDAVNAAIESFLSRL